MVSFGSKFVVLVFLGCTLYGADRSSWTNVKGLTTGQAVEVTDRKNQTIKGTLSAVAEDSISVATKQQTMSVARNDVSRVRVRPGARRKYMLVGMAVGAGAGLGLGAAGGESLAQTSGGDFAGIKPAVIGGCGAAGALVGAVVGSILGGHASTIYSVK